MGVHLCVWWEDDLQLNNYEERERQVLLLAAPLGHIDSVINTLTVVRIDILMSS